MPGHSTCAEDRSSDLAGVAALPAVTGSCGMMCYKQVMWHSGLNCLLGMLSVHIRVPRIESSL